jgi:hypothetical protein
MHNYVIRRFNCLERVHYVSLNPDMLPLTPAETPLFAGVTTAWNELKNWGVGQEGGKRAFREGTSERRGAIRAIRGSMVEIAEMARSIEAAGIDPGISERFRMPTQRTYAAMVASGSAFAEAAEAAKALFIARGLAATFVDDLEAQIVRFTTSGAARANGLTRWTAGTAGLDAVARRGMDLVRQLRPMVRARLKSQPALVAAWDLASRVEAAGSNPATPPAGGGGSGSTPPSGS